MKPYDQNYEPTEVGVFEIEWDEYRKIRALNISSAKEMKRTPAHFKAALEQPLEATWQMNVGSAFHYLTLEPQRYDEYIVVDIAGSMGPAGKNGAFVKIDKKHKYYHEWAARQDGKIILSAEQIRNVNAMVEKMKSKKTVAAILSGGWAERTIIWKDPDFGFWCKGRVDWFPETMPGAIVDLKKTMDAGIWAFRKSIDRYDYNAQAWWYLTGATLATGIRYHDFFWIAWEDQPPHEGNVYKASQVDIAQAGDRLYPIRRRYAECLESGEWPGYDDRIVYLDDVERNEALFDESECDEDELIKLMEDDIKF